MERRPGRSLRSNRDGGDQRCKQIDREQNQHEEFSHRGRQAWKRSDNSQAAPMTQDAHQNGQGDDQHRYRSEGRPRQTDADIAYQGHHQGNTIQRITF